MLQSGYAFIASHIEIEGSLPIEVVPGLTLRRARPKEIEFIESYLPRNLTPTISRWPAYSGVVREERRVSGAQFHLEELPEERWKYWVFAFNGSNGLVHEIEPLLCLLPVDIDIAFQAYFQGPDQEGDVFGYSGIQFHIVEKYADFDQAFKNASPVSTSDLLKVGSWFGQYKALGNEYPHITHALQNYYSLRRIQRHSELRVIGYFAIIEALITHAPRLTETLDSIGHQLKNKMTLLRKRFSREISYEKYFLHLPEQKVWALLYSYRSCLAHGGRADFKTQFQTLKSQEAVTLFLKETLKELFILSLKEPEFMADLKQC